MYLSLYFLFIEANEGAKISKQNKKKVRPILFIKLHPPCPDLKYIILFLEKGIKIICSQFLAHFVQW
jgi:hypothetical protein